MVVSPGQTHKLSSGGTWQVGGALPRGRCAPKLIFGPGWALLSPPLCVLEPVFHVGGSEASSLPLVLLPAAFAHRAHCLNMNTLPHETVGALSPRRRQGWFGAAPTVLALEQLPSRRARWVRGGLGGWHPPTHCCPTLGYGNCNLPGGSEAAAAGGGVPRRPRATLRRQPLAGGSECLEAVEGAICGLPLTRPPPPPPQPPEGQDRAPSPWAPGQVALPTNRPSCPQGPQGWAGGAGGYVPSDAELCHPDQGSPWQSAWSCPCPRGQARAGQRPWVWWKRSYTAAASMPCPPHGTQPSPSPHRHFGSQTLPPGPGVRPADAEELGGAGEQGVPSMAGPGSPDPEPYTIVPGVPWGGCEGAGVGSRRQRGLGQVSALPTWVFRAGLAALPPGKGAAPYRLPNM